MIDPELQAAVDAFFDGWKHRVEERLEVGESRYHGKWKGLSAAEVTVEMMDEILDMLAYAAMLRAKVESTDPGG